MKFCSLSFVLVLLTVAVYIPGAAQKPAAKTDGADDSRGFTEVETFQGTTNSQESVLKLDSTLGYDFNKHFGLFGGVPVYFTHIASTTTGTTTTSSANRSGFGNLYLGLALRAPNPTLDYEGTITAGAPTGSRTNGLSSGRGSIDFDNRFQHSFSRLTPFFDGGVANTVPDSVLFTRPFTSLGAISHLEEGASLGLLPRLSVGASAYQIVPFGNQKIFSRLLKKGQTTGTTTKHRRTFQTSALASGNDLTRENGFNAWIGVDPSRFWGLEAGYTRSATFDLNSFTFNLRFNIGKALRSQKGS